MTKVYRFKNIRALLTEGFTDDELRRVCYDEPAFRPMYDQLARETGKARIIDYLLEFANRQLQLEALLAIAKDRNPTRYLEHQPYYDDIPDTPVDTSPPIPLVQAGAESIGSQRASSSYEDMLYEHDLANFVNRQQELAYNGPRKLDTEKARNKIEYRP